MYLTSPWLGLVMAAFAVAPLIMERSDWPPPVIAGTLIAPLTWVAFSLLLNGASRARSANPSSYGEIQSRLIELEARLGMAPPGGGGAQKHVDDAKSRLTSSGQFQWARGFGYVEVWKSLHRAMEDLTMVETDDKVWAAWIRVRLRLLGSEIPQKTELLDRLDKAHCVSVWDIGKRQEVRQISEAVNLYRDENWAQIVRARNQLIVSTAMLGLVAYVLLLVALTSSPPRGAVIAASILFLVGVIVGLFDLTLTRSEAGVAIEDYGLNFARSQIIPISAGIAAVFGVVLTAMLSSSALTALLAPKALTSTGSVDQAAATVQTLIFEIGSAFDLIRHPGGLLVAALFGLTPRLLLEGLQGQTERYKRELKSTEAAGAST